jgi:hypothetical protein
LPPTDECLDVVSAPSDGDVADHPVEEGHPVTVPQTRFDLIRVLGEDGNRP